VAADSGPSELAGGGEQGGDVVFGVQIGGRPSDRGKPATLRDLGRWIERLQPAGKAANDAQTHVQPRRERTLGRSHPPQRQLARDPLCARLFQVGDELVEQQAVAGELEPESSAHGEVVGE